MKVINGKTEVPVSVREDSELRGMITADTTVVSGITLIVRGMITADLIVESNARAIVNGMVNGCIHNAGYVELHGQADTLQEAPGATTKILGTGYFKGPMTY